MNYPLILNQPILIKRKSKIILKISWILNLILIASFTLYIFQVSSFVKDFYLIGSYEKKLENLKKETEILEINFSKSNSLSQIEDFLSKGDFVKSKNVKYLQILDTSIVKN